MNIPFPKLYPRLVDPKWFNADSPCDEDAELISLEEAHQQWLNSIGPQFTRVPIGKPNPEPMDEEADSDEEGNDESDDSEESHDEDEEDEVHTSQSPSRFIDLDRLAGDVEPDSLEDINEGPDNNTSDQSAIWPLQ